MHQVWRIIKEGMQKRKRKEQAERTGKLVNEGSRMEREKKKKATEQAGRNDESRANPFFFSQVCIKTHLPMRCDLIQTPGPRVIYRVPPRKETIEVHAV